MPFRSQWISPDFLGGSVGLDFGYLAITYNALVGNNDDLSAELFTQFVASTG